MEGTGIAVGMATIFHQHNLPEVIFCTSHIFDEDPDATTANLMEAYPGPVSFQPWSGVMGEKLGIRAAI